MTLLIDLQGSDCIQRSVINQWKDRSATASFCHPLKNTFLPFALKVYFQRAQQINTALFGKLINGPKNVTLNNLLKFFEFQQSLPASELLKSTDWGPGDISRGLFPHYQFLPCTVIHTSFYSSDSNLFFHTKSQMTSV